MTFPASLAIRAVGLGASRRFGRAVLDAQKSQADRLRSILAANARTEYGERYGFASVSDVQDYRRQVPVIDYTDIADDVDRIANGERGVLTAEAPRMFAQTSGTSGKPKLIPVTPTCQSRAHSDVMRTWFYRALRDHPRMFAGKIVSLVSPAVEGHTAAGIPFGSTSGMIYRDMPWLLRRSYVVPYEVFEVDDYGARYYAVIRLALRQPVTFVCTANPSSVAKLCEVADENADDLIRDLRDGTISADLPSRLKSTLASGLRPDPEGARHLEQARHTRDGHLLPCDYWPDLQLLGCWKGGTVGAYIERLQRWFAPDDAARMVDIRDWGYLSSEARCSVPITDEGAGGVLAVASNFYEFVPTEDVDAHPDEPERWTYLGAHEIEQPREYHVLLTTTGGLYRYDINDVIRVVGHEGSTPVIEFVRKGRGMTSLTGEKLSVDQVLEGITKAAHEVGVELAHVLAVAVVEDCRYDFLVQPDGEPDDAVARRLLHAIDAKLSEINIEYAGKRASQRLADPRLHIMREGWHDSIKRATGRRVFQSKTVVLRNSEGSEHLQRQFCDRTIQWA